MEDERVYRFIAGEMTAEEQEAFQQECGICYTFDLDGVFPDMVGAH